MSWIVGFIAGVLFTGLIVGIGYWRWLFPLMVAMIETLREAYAGQLAQVPRDRLDDINRWLELLGEAPLSPPEAARATHASPLRLDDEVPGPGWTPSGDPEDVWPEEEPWEDDEEWPNELWEDDSELDQDEEGG